MSYFGQVRQLGYVVHDLESAMEYWRTVLKVGPFFHFAEIPVGDFRYNDRETDAVVSGALANCGDLQIELLQPKDDKPSAYRDFLRQGREGLQHVAFWTETFDHDLARAEKDGFRTLLSGYAMEPAGRFVYFDDAHSPHPGAMVELSALTGKKKEVFAMVKQRSLDWDGLEPVQRLD